ncbi:hypothetical protein PhCBS80983_g00131 [Powellomyces hirtus]|uniref:Uncharacterized protein n=1 Tax=Powellomyces hirtus TaxID=109895 RepID=A0A507EGL8_9FUNG|nr:hypothetical protein PhCBS80983_g00131 [Powellomyces hirtus]
MAPTSPTCRRRKLSLPTTSRHRPVNGPPQGVYVGIQLQPLHRVPAFSVYVHDGFYEVDYTTQLLDLEATSKFAEVSPNDEMSPNGRESAVLNGSVTLSKRNRAIVSTPKSAPRDFIDSAVLRAMESAIISWLKRYAKTHHYKIHAAGIGVHDGQSIAEEDGETMLSWDHINSGRLRLHAQLWFELDILPVIVHTRGASLDERACSAARKAQLVLIQSIAGNLPRISCGFRHEVEIDGNGHLHFADLIDFEKTVQPETWKVFKDLVDKTAKKQLKIAFFNSTTQGGGVALMRHALLRLLRLTDVDIRWFVMKPKPEIFDITKRKFHNVLQGVADKATHLTDEDKAMFEDWAEDNVQRYWAEGPVLESDVIIIDDPQPCGIIPYIKRLNPNCKIIYRSHIEVTAHLADDPKTEQHHVWQYLWNFIKHADLFISHPVANFVPSNVPRDKLLLQPAATDLLDGLNKPLGANAISYYQTVFNRISIDTTGRTAHFGDRPYIIQIARFDPSKGIFDVLEAYRLLRERLAAANVPLEKTPQLIISGHGSIDDPDGNVIFEQVLVSLEENHFDSILDDIIVARLPPSDQLLNALMRGALVALQLSTREGFEVKVTEALQKGVPVIAYAAGGIPHQIQHGRTGYLVKIGDIAKVVHYLERLVTNESLRATMSKTAQDRVGEEYFTVFSAINWLYLANFVSSGRQMEKADNAVNASRVTYTAVGDDLILKKPDAAPNGNAKADALPTDFRIRAAEPDAPDEKSDGEEKQLAETFDEQRAALSGNATWVKHLWQKEYGLESSAAPWAPQEKVTDATPASVTGEDPIVIWRK